MRACYCTGGDGPQYCGCPNNRDFYPPCCPYGPGRATPSWWPEQTPRPQTEWHTTSKGAADANIGYLNS